ncbi:MAG: hypothetical protein K2Y39_09075 [Candidatus Obscuribacterales bacterium]|nr:hypothetical protein [Candidatus Obscuribacterales bacterium]
MSLVKAIFNSTYFNAATSLIGFGCISACLCIACLVIINLIAFAPYLTPPANTIISETLTPDKKLKAVVFVRREGLGVGDCVNVSILRASAELPQEGLGSVFSGAGNWARVKWLGENTLLIFHHKQALFRKVDGAYVAFDRDVLVKTTELSAN